MGAIQRGTSWATIPKTLNRARTVHAPCAHRARTVRQRPLSLSLCLRAQVPGAWTLLTVAAGATCPAPRSAHAAVGWGGDVYVHGGMGDQGTLGDLWRLRVQGDAEAEWTRLEVAWRPQPGPKGGAAAAEGAPRAHHSAAVQRDCLVLVGGQGPDLLTSAVVSAVHLPTLWGAHWKVWRGVRDSVVVYFLSTPLDDFFVRE